MAVVQRSLLCCIPQELLEHVAVSIVQIDPSTGPSALIPLLLTCKHINSALAFHLSRDLSARIFRVMFDVGAARRRLGDGAVFSQHLTVQLQKYVVNLKRIRSGDIFAPNLVEIFWTSFLMLSENDGKNRCQLDRAGLPDVVDRFIRTRMYENSWQHDGWPAENALNTLALWLFWKTITKEKLLAESAQRRQQIINIVLPYVLLPFRYPSAHAPPNHFKFPLCEEFERQYPHSIVTAHGPYPLYRDPDEITESFTHYGIPLNFSRPLITLAAKLIYFSHREVVPFDIPPQLPVSRAHAIQLGYLGVGPTQADIIEVNSHTDTKLVPQTKWDWWEDLTEEELEREDRGVIEDLKSASSKWDNDWMRLAYCSNPWVQVPGKGRVYSSGVLNGLWQGRMLFPNEFSFMELISTSRYPPLFSESTLQVSTVPVYMRLQEHHCVSPQLPVNIGGVEDGFDDGLANAYLPSITIQKDETNVLIEANGEKSIYETYVPGRANSHNEDTCLICLNDPSLSGQDYDADFAAVGMDTDQDGDEMDGFSGECTGIMDIFFYGDTDLRHAQAWNPFTYIGRVRPWDGLIAILRIPRDSRHGRIIFYGYIVGGQNFVGNWRLSGSDIGVPTWESSFSMSRRED